MSDILQPGTLLNQGNYRIEKVLGQGGFGITYLATDIVLSRFVAIKEFFPKDFCGREDSTEFLTSASSSNKNFIVNLKNKFLKEARNIAKLNNAGIIKIYTAFEENNTAYYVMEYIEGVSLAEIIKKNGAVSLDKAVKYVTEISQSLSYIHRNQLNHLDVKPANIMIRRSSDAPVLIDFGLSKQYDKDGNQTSTTPTGISHGFAPIEQYCVGGVSEFSPSTDLYSLAATFFCMITGKNPPSAPELNENGLDFPSNIPTHIQHAISKAMSLNKNERHETVSDFIRDINESENTNSNSKKLPLYIIPLIVIPIGLLTWFIMDKLFMNSKDDNLSQNLVENVENDSYGLNKSADLKEILQFFNIGDKSNDEDHVALENNESSEQVGNYPLAEDKSVEKSVALATPDYRGHDAVDLGLSVNWATCNLGASQPSDFGDYFVWGVTHQGFGYNYANVSYICGNPNYDAASAMWGGGWRMPSADECKELINKCRWVWTRNNGVNGYNVIGPNGNSIFLPAAGYYADGYLQYSSTNGNYWSGTGKGEKAYYISFHSTYHERRLYGKDRARSIRPVIN